MSKEIYTKIRKQFKELDPFHRERFSYDSANAKRILDLVIAEPSYKIKRRMIFDALVAYRAGLEELAQEEISWRSS